MMVAGLSFIAFPGLFSYGFASAATTFGVFAILLITIVWNKRYGMAAFSVYVIFILFVAYGFTKGSLGDDFDFNAYLHSPTAWSAVFTGIIIQAYIFISAIGSYKDRVWALQKEVAYKSDHDFLTGLFNRQKIHEVLNDKIADESVSRFALFFMDLDGFKVVNDIYGHEVGDFVLQEIGRRLHQQFEGGFVARYGGDEFTAVLDTGSEEMLHDICRKVIDSFRAPVFCDGKELVVGVSVGVAVYPTAGKTLNALKRVADLAMYKVKDGGKNNYCIQTS